MNLRSTIGILAISALFIPVLSTAQTADEIKTQIDAQNAKIAALDAEIAQFQKQLDAASNQKQTLQSTIAGLKLQIQSMNAKITKTKNQISTTELTIQQLSSTIAGKQDSIESQVDSIMELLRKLGETEDAPLALKLLSAQNVSSTWQDVDQNETLQTAIRDNIDKLSQEKTSLEDTKTKTEAAKAKLVQQKNQLVAQQGSLSAVKSTSDDLLKQTKAQESSFQKILADKQLAKASFEAALNDLNAQFQQAIDPSKILAAGKGILAWPLDNVRITQTFGNTAFAKSGAYNGKGHNGIDLAAPIGTPVKAALSGTVIGTGNTDAYRGCYSFGKWVMVKHNNGLNTMYAHFSQISVTTGQSVSTGEILGYSGETGYATGPHLHFGVYVSSATQIVTLGSATKSTTPCAKALMPVVPLSGYLNPMSYL